MLAREFKTADELEISQHVHDKLVDFTRLDEVSTFDMRGHCIAHHALGGIQNYPGEARNWGRGHCLLRALFFQHELSADGYETPGYRMSRSATFREAQEATRNALTFGDPMWSHVLALRASES